jgi:hypothetical protein
MKKLFILAIITLNTSNIFGQIKDPISTAMAVNDSKTSAKQDDLVENKPKFQNVDGNFAMDDRYEGVKGNRFFYDDKYHEGTLIMTKNREFGKDMLFRFDQLEGTVQLKYPDGREILVDQNEVLNFNLFIENKSVIFVRMKTPKSDKFALVQVIYYSPTLKVVRDPRKKLKRVDNTGAYSSNQIFDTFENDYHYFLQNGEENMQEVKPTAKSLSKAMPEKAKKIESLFKTAKGKGELSVSKLAEIMKKLDDKPATEAK